MKVYRVGIVISGNNDNPETRSERIISNNWQESLELLARVCRDTSCAIRSMVITETRDDPFDHKVQVKEFPRPAAKEDVVTGVAALAEEMDGQ